MTDQTGRRRAVERSTKAFEQFWQALFDAAPLIQSRLEEVARQLGETTTERSNK